MWKYWPTIEDIGFQAACKVAPKDRDGDKKPLEHADLTKNKGMSWLVGGIPTPSEKYEFVSWNDFSQYMEKCSKPPTRW